MSKLHRVGFVEGEPYSVKREEDGPLYLADEVDEEIERLKLELEEKDRMLFDQNVELNLEIEELKKTQRSPDSIAHERWLDAMWDK